MEDRKSRIAKLSERFKPQPERSEKPARQRERRSLYIATDTLQRVDERYKELNHQSYPQTVNKSLFMEAVIEYGLSNLDAVKELMGRMSGNKPTNGD